VRRDQWRCLWALTRMELLRLLRTREVWTRMLGPALAFPLFGLALLAGAMSFRDYVDASRVVAVSADVPEELDVVGAFAAQDWTVRVAEDPKALLEAGEVELAITRWVPGPGLGSPLDMRLAPMPEDFSFPDRPRGDRYLWTVHVWDSEESDGTPIRAFRTIEESVFGAELASRGLAADTLDWPLTTRLLEPDDRWDSGPGRITDDLPDIAGYEIRAVDLAHVFAVIMASSLGIQILCLFPVADRSEGIFETLATTAAPARLVILSRGLAGGAFLWVATLFLSLPVAGTVRFIEGDVFTMLEVTVWMTSAVIFVTASYVPVGLWSRSIQDANTFGAYASAGAVTGALLLVWLPAGSALLCAILWAVLWLTILGGTASLAASPRADLP